MLPGRGGELLPGLGDRQPIGALDRATAAPAVSVPVSTEEKVDALSLRRPLEAEPLAGYGLFQLVCEAC